MFGLSLTSTARYLREERDEWKRLYSGTVAQQRYREVTSQAAVNGTAIEVRQPREELAWIEDGEIFVTDRFYREFAGGYTLPSDLPGYVKERDPSIRSWRFVPETKSRQRAYKIVASMLNDEVRHEAARMGVAD